MGRAPCCDNIGVKKGPWTPEEDKVLVDYIEKNGHGSWRQLPKLAGLNRCGKSCRLRWTNYLRPDIKRGKFSEEEERLIIHLHAVLGNKWSAIATRLPGRTDNEVKNHWNTNLRKKLLQMGLDPVTHRPRTDLSLLWQSNPKLLAAANLGSLTSSSWDTALRRIQANSTSAALVTKLQLLQRLIGATNTPLPPTMDVMNMLGSACSLTNHHQLNAPPLGLTDPAAAASPAVASFQGLPNNYFNQPMATELSVSIDGGCPSEQLCIGGNCGSTNYDSYMNPTSNSLPSASPEKNKVDFEDSSAALFQVSDGLNTDHLGNDLSWKDILDQISWSDDL